MKKLLLMMAVTVVGLSLVACGEKTNVENNVQQEVTSNTESTNNTINETQTTSSSAGTLKLSKSDIAVVVNGTKVPMPYKLKDLESAGIPSDETRDGKELAAGDFFSANIYLDENEDYVLIPAYYNKADSAVSIMDAEAEEITMTTYADEPVDQGVSILGVSFGMTRSELFKLLGNPVSNDGSYFEWHIELSDMNYEGTLSIYVTGDSDDAGVSQVNLNVFPK